MICAKCGGDYQYPQEIKTYGLHALCNYCLADETQCTVCGKKRHNKNVEDICEGCTGMLRVPPIELEATIDVAAPPIGVGRPTLPPPAAPIEDKLEVVKCSHCGMRAVFTPETTRGDKFYCGHCFYLLKMCSRCGEFVDYTLYIPGLRTNLCRGCRHKEGIGFEHNWKYRPNKFFLHGAKNSRLYLGIENEVQVKETHSKVEYIGQIARAYQDDVVYTQFDGSIDYGTEVVMHPHTFSALKAFDFAPMFSDMIKPSTTTGMHIHLTRSAFKNKLHLYKFMRFISGNKTFVERIACRRSGGCQQWRFTEGGVLVDKVKGHQVDRNKYVDINLEHFETVELRIFKGVVTEYQMRRNIEFCHALFKFSQQGSPEEMKHKHFRAFVCSKQSIYPNLQKYLETAKFN